MFEKKFYSTFGNDLDDYINKELMPLSHLTEKDAKYILEIDLPFVNKKDISVVLTSQHLVIRAKLEKTCSVSKLGRVAEFNYFKKTFSLPSGIDFKKISAKFNEGMLRITLPKILKGKKLSID